MERPDFMAEPVVQAHPRYADAKAAIEVLRGELAKMPFDDGHEALSSLATALAPHVDAIERVVLVHEAWTSRQEALRPATVVVRPTDG